MSEPRARKRFGQHFLHDQQIIQQIVFNLGAQPHDTVVEIGPGRGALTKYLCQQYPELDVIELDRDLIETLHHKAYASQLHIHAGDVLNFDFSDLALQKKQSLHLIGNLPYNISTPLLFHLCDHTQHIQQMLFMLQKEVVQRLAATPNNKNYGRLSVLIQYYYQVEALFDVPPTAFTPPPKVNSSIVRLVPHSESPVDIEFAKLKIVVDKAFAQRRKTLRNNLKGLINTADIEALGIDPGCRAETLDLTKFAKLASSLIL